MLQLLMAMKLVSIQRMSTIIGDECTGALLCHVGKSEPILETIPTVDDTYTRRPAPGLVEQHTGKPMENNGTKTVFVHLKINPPVIISGQFKTLRHSSFSKRLRLRSPESYKR